MSFIRIVHPSYFGWKDKNKCYVSTDLTALIETNYGFHTYEDAKVFAAELALTHGSSIDDWFDKS